ncbi:MAG TPA: NAD(P)/FAD-dependent oxidoreductase [Candidatus Portnoybacteria bacterium]|nr:NAD(P)/FAD-dependent oxidoreductase [Candidatus Portnoybacteria bacterium]
MWKIQDEFDIAVIGGGPAGLMAAARAAASGARVVLVEKNLNPGKKLLLSGGGRCNISHAEFDDKKFAQKFGQNGQWLLSALASFGAEETIEFFEAMGLKTITEKDGRVFPASGQAQDVLATLFKSLKENKVKLMLGKEVLGFELKDEAIISAQLAEREILAQAYVLCVGGRSYPITGSTGQGYEWAQAMGHKIVNPRPALVPIKIKESWVGGLQGISLKNVEVSFWQKNKNLAKAAGDILFTHFGLSGPTILDLSKSVGEALAKGGVVLKIDLMPGLNIMALDKKLQEDFKRNKNIRNYLSEFFPQRFSDSLLHLSRISPDKKLSFITKEERETLLGILKGLELNVKDLLGFNEAIITAGGVELKEIDSKTMRSKKIKNLYFAGEMIDLDGPTGGYNLQLCWTTGFVAGASAGNNA